MKKNKIVSILILLIIFMLMLSVQTLAAKGSFSISKSSVSLKEGGTSTFSITATNCEGRFLISSSDSSIVKVSSSSVWVTGSESITLTAVKQGTATITITANNVGDTDENEVEGSKSISVTVKAKQTTTNTNNNSSGTGNNKGNNTTAPSFSSVNQTVYATSEANVRSSYSTSSSIIGSLKQGDSVKRTGIGSNGWSKVTYNGQTAYVSTDLLTTTKSEVKQDDKKDEEKSNNKNLKSLKVSPSSLDSDFVASTTEYTMTVGSDIDTIKVEAVAEDSKAKVSISGNKSLKVGTNTISIKVTAEDETVRTYKIIVTKEKQEQLKLKELLVGGMPLQPEFDSNIYEYTITLDDNNVSELNITATPNKEKANVEILGNTQLKAGENTITILLKSKDGSETATYQIKVNVSAAQDTQTNKTSENDLFKYIGIGVLVGALIIAIIIFISKRRKKDEDIEINDLPKLEDEDLPRSLRKNKEPVEKKEENKAEVEDVYEDQDRKKRIDDFYANDDDETLKKRRGIRF